MEEWTRACSHLSRHIPESHLKLSVVCDVDSEDLAKIIVKPLLGLPKLADFAIRLHPHIDKELDTKLYPLAHSLCQQVTCQALSCTSTLPFRYTDLPAELQCRVLEFTDLVAPYDLTWVRGEGLRCNDWDEIPQYCVTCWSVHDQCAWPPWQEPGYPMAQKCACWWFPLSPFLVNRATHENATRVFYSLNHFRTSPSRCPKETDDLAMPVADFLTIFSEKPLRYLRVLRICIYGPVSPLGYPDSLLYQAWDNAWTRLQPANLSRLCIIFEMCDGLITRDMLYGRGEGAFRAHCQRLMVPLITLHSNDLKDFFLHLSSLERDYSLLRWALERDLEKLVMGNTYDSQSRGKYTIPEQNWNPKKSSHLPII